MTGSAYRVPVQDVSLVDLNLKTVKPTTYDEICAKVKEASETTMKGVLEYVDDEVVSSDFLADPHTSIFDAREGIALNDDLFKFILFYDNEFGYATKTVELAKYMNEIDNK
jgi:glyceraldehyde 3-phosphate dehydrogenase